jgi:tRNA (cmo5U34)-methyltransferase
VLQPFGERFTLHAFDLAAADWRSFPWPVQAVVSSLAIHHLDGEQKRKLYRDLYRLIDPGGALIIADLIQPVHPLGLQLAARVWDEAVRQAALARDGNESAFEVFQRDHWNIFHYPDRWINRRVCTNNCAGWKKRGSALSTWSG